MQDLPIPVAYRLCRDLFRPRPIVYWLDFTASCFLGWGAFLVALREAVFSPLFIAAYLVSVFAVYRAAIFIHELAHLKKGTFSLFRKVWNGLIGIPFLVPSLAYQGVHYEHHRQAIYGTRRDGEYYPFVREGWAAVARFFFAHFLFPPLIFFRFLVLTPLSWFFSPLRRFLWQKASSLVIDPNYTRPDPTPEERRTWRIQETACFFYTAGVSFFMARGWLPVKAFWLWYAVGVGVFLANALRTLAAHRYREGGDDPMTVSQQFLDSVTVTGNPITTPLWAPVGLRFHAVHHLFPSMPYHNLGEAHRRLAARFGENTPYLQTVEKSLFSALGRLFRDIRTARKLSHPA